MILTEEVRRLIDRIIADDLCPKDVESDSVEFKAWPMNKEGHVDKSKVSDFAQKYSVCFANSGGGILVFGIANDSMGRKALEGCESTNEVDLNRVIFDSTRPSVPVEVEEIPYMGLMFVAVRVLKSKKVHATSDGKRYRRLSGNCVPVYPDDDIVVEVEKGSDYTSKFVSGVFEEAVDVNEIARLRSHLRTRGSSDIASLRDDDLLIALDLGERSASGLFRPNVAGLLLAGKGEILDRMLPQAEIGVFSFRADNEPDLQEFIRGPLLASLERVVSLVEPYNKEVTVRVGLFEIPIPRLPKEVLREALLNAVTHRDYLSTGSVHVRLYADRTEISNPGGFPEDITPENILYHEPRPRNRTLAEALQKIGLVNRAGIGVDRIYKILLENGKEPPHYIAKPTYVVLKVLHEVNESFARFVVENGRSGTTFDLDEILVLKYLCRNSDVDSTTASVICQRTLPEIREILNRMVKRNLLDKRGQKKGQRFSLSGKMCDKMGEGIEYTRDRGIDEIRYPEMIRSYLRDHGRIRNKDVQHLCGIDSYHAVQLLTRLRLTGEIELRGTRRGAHYVLARTKEENVSSELSNQRM